ncbi:MAG: CotH kinase family protein [Blautia sp.]
MKRIISLFVAVLMILSMCVTAGASGTGESAETGTDQVVAVNDTATATEDTVNTTENSASPSVSIENTYVAVGQEITAVPAGYPEGSELSYSWKVGEEVKESTGAVYIPAEADQEKWIQVTVTCEGYDDQTAKIYFSSLPVMYLNFDLNAVLADKNTYVDGTMKLQGDQEFTSSKKLYDGALEVKGRGNTSWLANKKPFKLKLDSKTDILGMGKNKHWVLLANATEGSLMRNDLAYKLSGLWGLTYQDGKWIQLIINGEYYGNYYLCEHIRIGSTRVDIEDLADNAADAAAAIAEANVLVDADGNPVDAENLAAAMEENLSWISTDSFTFNEQTVKISDYYKFDKDTLLSGGYLFELDGYYDEISKFRSSLNQPIMFNSPEYANTNQDMIDYAETFINSFETAIQSSDFHAAYKGANVSAYDLFDFDSLVKYWLVEEIFMNVDAMKKSTYFYKAQDTANGISKMVMGPVWDMDWSSNGEGGSDYAVWQTVKYQDSAQANQWYKYLCKDPYFLTRAREYYWAHRSEIKDMVASIYNEVATEIFKDNAYDYLYNAAMVNQELWGTYKQGYTGEVDKLYTWLNNRVDWLDTHMASVDTMIESMGLYTADNNIKLSFADGKLTVAAQGSNAEILVNGSIADTVNLSNGSAELDISGNLTDERDVIYVVVRDEEGKTAGSNFCYDQEEEKGEMIEVKIVSEPRNTVFTIGSDMDLTGLQVQVIYSGGSSEIISNNTLQITGFDSSETGKKAVTVNVGSFSDTFEVTIVTEDQKAGDWTNDYITIYTDADKNGDKIMQLEVWKHGESQLYGSTQGIAYSGDFADLNFSFVTERGWQVHSVKFRDAGGDQNGYSKTIGRTSGSFTFSGNSVTDRDGGNVLIIDLVEIEEEEPVIFDFSLNCNKPTIKVNTNAVIYLTCNEKIAADQISASENGTPIEFSYTPTCTDNGDGTYKWKLYIKPTVLGIHYYTITAGGVEKTVKIKAAKTVFSR